MDDATANWYNYHFDDDLLLHDTAWRHWRLKLQAILTAEQLAGRACAVCTKPIDYVPKDSQKDYLGGYTLVTCVEQCNFPEITGIKLKRSAARNSLRPK